MKTQTQAWNFPRHPVAIERSVFAWFCATFNSTLSIRYQFSSVLDSSFKQLGVALLLQKEP
jgi:hypothetical protein